MLAGMSFKEHQRRKCLRIRELVVFDQLIDVGPVGSDELGYPVDIHFIITCWYKFFGQKDCCQVGVTNGAQLSPFLCNDASFFFEFTLGRVERRFVLVDTATGELDHESLQRITVLAHKCKMFTVKRHDQDKGWALSVGILTWFAFRVNNVIFEDCQPAAFKDGLRFDGFPGNVGSSHDRILTAGTVICLPIA